MLNDNQKIVYQKFFSLSFWFVYIRIPKFNTNEHIDIDCLISIVS